MGGFFSRLWRKLRAVEPTRVLMVGLDSAGKTSVLYRMKLGSSIQTLPTVGFNTETVQVGNLTLQMWDVGGQMRLRPLWKYYTGGSCALIFVVDSSDRARFDEARDEFQAILQDQTLRNSAVLVLANKQDLPGAASADEVGIALGIKEMKLRLCHVQPTCAVTGAGMQEALDWLATNLAAKAPPSGKR